VRAELAAVTVAPDLKASRARARTPAGSSTAVPK